MVHRLPAAVGLILITTLWIPFTDSFAQSSYELDKLDSAMRAPALVQDSSISNGSHFLSGTDPGTARRYMNDFIKQSNQMISTVNSLTNATKGSEAGQAAYNRIIELQSYVSTMRTALPEYEKAFAAGDAATAAGGTGSQAPAVPQPASESAPASVAQNAMSTASALDPELDDITTSLGRLDEMLASGDYDGAGFNPLMSVDEVNAFSTEFTSTANATVESMNALPSESARSAEGRQALDRLYSQLNVARSFRGAKSRHAQKRVAMEKLPVRLQQTRRLNARLPRLPRQLRIPIHGHSLQTAVPFSPVRCGPGEKLSTRWWRIDYRPEPGERCIGSEARASIPEQSRH